ncbi:hypothetical protein OEZ86_004672 [Tetradesmus obliquus]|nr:hypothetical protein OEZ86_004672 [Tetradesmus obliquus]
MPRVTPLLSTAGTAKPLAACMLATLILAIFVAPPAGASRSLLASYSTSSNGSGVCNVCSAGFGVPSSAFAPPVWRCVKCPLGSFSAGNTTQACSNLQQPV